MLLQLRGNRDVLARQKRRDPFRGPGAFAGIVDPGERLQRDRFGDLVGERAAEIVPVAAHCQRRRADAAAEIEREDLRALVAAELQGHQRQQHALAGTGRADHQGMADIADMKRKAERGRTLGPREEERRRVEMLVLFRAGPDRRERHHVREVEGRDRRLADIGIDMAGQAAEPGFERVDGLAHAGEVATLDGLLDEAQPLVGDPESSSQTVTVAVT